METYQRLIITSEDRRKYEAMGLAKWPTPHENGLRAKMAVNEHNREKYRLKCEQEARAGRERQALQDQVDLLGEAGQQTPEQNC